MYGHTFFVRLYENAEPGAGLQPKPGDNSSAKIARIRQAVHFNYLLRSIGQEDLMENLSGPMLNGLHFNLMGWKLSGATGSGK